MTMTAERAKPEVSIGVGLRCGDLAQIVALHAREFQQLAGFGARRFSVLPEAGARVRPRPGRGSASEFLFVGCDDLGGRAGRRDRPVLRQGSRTGARTNQRSNNQHRDLDVRMSAMTGQFGQLVVNLRHRPLGQRPLHIRCRPRDVLSRHREIL